MTESYGRPGRCSIAWLVHLDAVLAAQAPLPTELPRPVGMNLVEEGGGCKRPAWNHRCVRCNYRSADPV